MIPKYVNLNNKTIAYTLKTDTPSKYFTEYNKVITSGAKTNMPTEKNVRNANETNIVSFHKSTA